MQSVGETIEKQSCKRENRKTKYSVLAGVDNSLHYESYISVGGMGEKNWNSPYQQSVPFLDTPCNNEKW